MHKLALLLLVLAACAPSGATPAPDPASNAGQGLSGSSSGGAMPGDTGAVYGSRLKPYFITASDGLVIEDHSRWYDSLRLEECRFVEMSWGEFLCLPPSAPIVAERFADASCATPVFDLCAAPPVMYVQINPGASGCGTAAKQTFTFGKLGKSLPKGASVWTGPACQELKNYVSADDFARVVESVSLSEFVSAKSAPLP